MIRRMLLTALVGAGLTLSANAADVFVRIAPPRPLVERRAVAPGRGYVWTPGYQRWDGRAYAWSPGAWVLPPRAHSRWVPAHWAKRRGGWVFVEGHWR
ncbi:MAG: YXWGXW repeat-containing protein [Bryobacteraceae bacterium]